ncbi:MAG TPA: S4 domain-containing protein, partial [Herpetosiphonaceae bacterium]
REIVTQFHNTDAAREGEEYFIRTIQKREIPEEMPEYRIANPTSIVDVLAGAQIAGSKSEARRLIAGGGVRINGNRVESQDTLIEPGSEYVVQVGKRKFVRVVS